MTQEGFKRKLTAIFSADVVGYSRLMEEDEETTIKTLNIYRNSMASLIRQHRGRVVDMVGDNLMAEFTSAVDAVNCSVEIQRELAERNMELAYERKMEFRIGVNVGDVISEEDRIYGEGVNIAARMESMAIAGGICISGSAYDQVANKLKLEYENLGEHQVKNINTPIRVYRVLSFPGAAAHRVIKAKKSVRKKWLWVAASMVTLLLIIFSGLYWKYFYLPTPESIDSENKLTFDLPQGPSIAVLPFDNLTSNSDQDFISDGITENIIYALSQVRGLFVIARNTTFAYKGKSTDVREIGKELGVQYIIEGSIQNFGELIRFTVQLVETKTGNHIWSDVYDKELVEFFELQDEIAMKICEAMQIQITDGETFRNRYKGITDVKIGMKILKAFEHLRYRQSPESFMLGFNEVKEILEMGFESQIVYGLLGFYNLYSIELGICKNPIVCFGKATEATRKALSYNEENSDVNIVSAYLFLLRKDHSNSIKAAKKAVFLNPNNGDAYLLLGVILNYAGRPIEAISYLKKAIRIDPIPPAMYLFNLGISYHESKQYEKAVVMFNECRQKK